MGKGIRVRVGVKGWGQGLGVSVDLDDALLPAVHRVADEAAPEED